MSYNAAFFCNKDSVDYVYGDKRTAQINEHYSLCPDFITAENLEEKLGDLQDLKYVFSTWGMTPLDSEQISKLPSLEAVFYAAGSVQSFARPLLDAGITVMSSWGANAVPVAEYTVSQIQMASTGFFHLAETNRSPKTKGDIKNSEFPGCFEITVAILGAGMIGSMICERLKNYEVDVIVFDPFLSDERAAELGVEVVSIEEAFSRGQVISNHIANLPTTEGLIKGEYFAKMLPYSTFINTGRGLTIEEDKMLDVLEERPDIYALLDVAQIEPPEEDSRIWSLPNVIYTPHIAGSLGNEVRRMADYAIAEAKLFREGKELNYAVTHKMLETMA
ncbi:MAG: hydroxyacid dehydrogenase [Lentisphaeria bacterium]|nr:hydroxyacid dehydrogenase [Lentisphaeria bacterium]